MQPQNDTDDQIEDDGTNYNESHTKHEVHTLSKYGITKYFTDDYSCKTDNDGATSHIDVCKALILCEESAREGNQSIRYCKTDDLHDRDIDPLCQRHMRIITGRTNSRTLLRSKVPVHKKHNNCNEDKCNHNGLRYISKGYHKIVDINRYCLIRTTHNIQIDGIESHLRQNSRQDVRNTQNRMEESSHNTCQNTCDYCNQKSDRSRYP